MATAQALTAYAFGFVEPEFEQYRFSDWQRAERAKNRAKSLYWRAKVYARRGLEACFCSRKIARAEDKPLKEFSETLQKAKRRHVPLLFWYAFSWGGYINLSKDDISAINNISKVEHSMKRILELDEDYFHGFAHMFLGIYYGSRPQMLGGNAQWSAQHFDRVDEINQNKMLMNKVLRAQYFATQEMDEDLFGRLLKEVQDAPEDLYPEQQLMNELAKKRAKILQDHAKELF
jgi:hypothetical protein